MNQPSVVYLFFRSLYKYILHRLTGQTEIERASRSDSVPDLGTSPLIKSDQLVSPKCSLGTDRTIANGTSLTNQTSARSSVHSKISAISTVNLEWRMSLGLFIVGNLLSTALKKLERLLMTVLQKNMSQN